MNCLWLTFLFPARRTDRQACCLAGQPAIRDSPEAKLLWHDARGSLVCADCGTRPRHRAEWQATSQCAARLPDAANEVLDTHGQALSAGRPWQPSRPVPTSSATTWRGRSAPSRGCAVGSRHWSVGSGKWARPEPGFRSLPLCMETRANRNHVTASNRSRIRERQSLPEGTLSGLAVTDCQPVAVVPARPTAAGRCKRLPPGWPARNRPSERGHVLRSEAIPFIAI